MTMATLEVIEHFEGMLIWGALATALLTIILSGSQGLGLSRLSLPFLIGTLLTGDGYRANVYGALTYFFGGWLFAFLYFALFARLHTANLWIGLLVGSVHGLFLLAVALPLLPYVHPRMTTEYASPAAGPRLEPPGFLGLNYGHRTPITTLIGHAVYGGVLGAFYGV